MLILNKLFSTLALACSLTFLVGIVNAQSEQQVRSELQKKIGPNTNIALGRFRDACNANGKPYASCIGAYVRIMVNQKPHPTQAGVVLDEITAVTKA